VSASVITFDGEGRTVEIPKDWGGNIAADENSIGVSLTWSAMHKGVGWQFYNDAEWTVAQMNGFTRGSKFDLLFTPAAGYSVKVDSFVFDDYTGYEEGSAFR
jgi:hypothetical protein